MNKTIFVVFIGLVLCAFLVSAIPYEIYPERLAFNPARNASLWSEHHHWVNLSDGTQHEKWIVRAEFQNNTPSSSQVIFYDNGQVEIISKGGLLVNGKKVCTQGDSLC